MLRERRPAARAPPQSTLIVSAKNNDRPLLWPPTRFHDGSTATLSEAVKAMGIAQLGRVLTDQQIAAIVAFLNTLTGTYRGHELRPATGATRAAPALP